MDPIIVGVAGATTSGKTTLVKAICEKLKLDTDKHVVHADAYFKRRGKPRHAHLNCSDWEQPASMDIPSLTKDLDEKAKQLQPYQLLFVEGFLLPAIPEVMSRCRFLIFLNIDRETCRQRRLRAGKQGRKQSTSTAAYFDHAIWPAYCEHNKHILDNSFNAKPLYVLDGKKTPEQLLDDARHALCEEGALFIACYA